MADEITTSMALSFSKDNMPDRLTPFVIADAGTPEIEYLLIEE